jgi:hypothetical protein
MSCPLPIRRLRLIVAGSLFILTAASSALSLTASEPQAPQRKGKGFKGPSGVYRDRVTPHWFANETKFWYRNDLKDRTKEFVLVDAAKGTRKLAFDHEKLAAGLAKAADIEVRADRLPFDDIELSDDLAAVQFDAANKRWKCDLESYACTELGPARKKKGEIPPPPLGEGAGGGVNPPHVQFPLSRNPRVRPVRHALRDERRNRLPLVAECIELRIEAVLDGDQIRGVWESREHRGVVVALRAQQDRSASGRFPVVEVHEFRLAGREVTDLDAARASGGDLGRIGLDEHHRHTRGAKGIAHRAADAARAHHMNRLRALHASSVA